MRKKSFKMMFERVTGLPKSLDDIGGRTADGSWVSFRVLQEDHVWRIRGSGITKQPEYSINVETIVQTLERNGIEVARGSSGSAVNANAYSLIARFRDGGLVGQTGNYWYGVRGVYVWGKDAMQHLAAMLEVQMPSETGL